VVQREYILRPDHQAQQWYRNKGTQGHCLQSKRLLPQVVWSWQPLCRTCFYFLHGTRKLSTGSLDQESKQDTVELKDDDPEALTMVLRHIYELLVVPNLANVVQWRTWLNIRVVANKYLEPKLEKMADEKYREAALACTDANEIFDVLDTIWTEMSHDESLVAFAEEIRRHNLGKLLKNARFREHLDRGGKEALWAQLDQLVFAADLRESRYALCVQHKARVFKSPESMPPGYAYRCSWCDRSGLDGGFETAWVPK
jgi:hypothetical protein